MIYPLFFLCLLLIIVITYRLHTSTPEELSKNELVHEDFRLIIKNLNYEQQIGFCFGFTLSWALDNLRKTDDKFYQIIELIRDEKNVLSIKLPEITKKIKEKIPLDMQDRKLVHIPSFIERMYLAQAPHHYRPIYKIRLNQTSINTILRLMDEEPEAKTPIIRIFAKTYSFNSKQRTTNYFLTLGRMLRENDNLVMLLHSNGHTIGLKKNGKQWLLIDINILYAQSLEYPYFILKNDELFDQLSKCLNQKNTLIFTTDFISNDSALSLKKRLERFNNNYPVFQQQIFYPDCKLDLLSLSIMNGDQSTTNKIISLNNQYKMLTPQQIASAVFYAIRMDQLGILKLIINTPGFKINMTDDDGSEVLGVAAYWGKARLVKHLLLCPGVKINAFNSKKETPLMLACRSEHTHQNTALFILLLEFGAYYHKKSLHIAMKFENQAAIAVLSKFKAVTSPIKHSLKTQGSSSLATHSSLFSPAKVLEKHTESKEDADHGFGSFASTN
ncbi:MAG: ankyrin repeat domain-containing protein [Legionella sp.]|nr:ankyrin repeat domain-containing protein [Legionella sp.]